MRNIKYGARTSSQKLEKRDELLYKYKKYKQNKRVKLNDISVYNI